MSDEPEYYVVDERERVVRKGPYEDDRQAKAEADRPNDIVVTGAALQLVEDSTALRWANEDGPEVIDAGGER